MEEQKPPKKEHDSFFDNFLKKYVSYFDGKYTNKIKNLELALKVSFTVLFFSFLMNGFLINTIIDISREKIIRIDVPESLPSGNYSLAPQWASENFHEMFARSIILNITNFNFVNIDRKVDDLLKYTPIEQEINSKAELIDETKFIKENKVTQNFDVKEWEVEPLKVYKKDKHKIMIAKVTAIGRLTRKVGSITTADNVKYKYPLEVKIISGLPWVKSLTPIYNDRKKRNKNRNKDKK